MPRQLRSFHPGTVPGGEVAVVHGQRLQLRWPTAAAGRVELRQLGIQQIERPAIEDDVVRHEEQHVLVVRKPKKADMEQRRFTQLERLRDLLRQSGRQHVLSIPGVTGRQVLERNRRIDRVQHDLHRLAVDDLDDGTQRRLPSNEVHECEAERLLIELAPQTMGRGHVEYRPPELQLLEVPHSLLHQRQGCPVAGSWPPRNRQLHRPALPGGHRETGGQPFDRRLLE